MRGLVPQAGYGVSLIVAGAYERFGTEEQKQEILKGITEGRVEAIAMSEPEAGSDVGNLSCKAERQNGGFVLNGQKTWISAAHIADHILVIARSDSSGSKHEGLTMFSVPTDSEGHRDPRHPDDGRQGGQRRLLDRLLRARGARPRPGRRRVDAADGRPERRAADPGGVGARHRAARVRRRPRLHQGAQAVRTADRLVPGAQAPHLGSRDRARVHAPPGLRRRPEGRRRTRARCSRARRRWRSSRPPRSRRRRRSRACR